MRRNFLRNNDGPSSASGKRWMSGMTFVAAILMCAGLMLPAAWAQTRVSGIWLQRFWT
jgi:hypothetical protein